MVFGPESGVLMEAWHFEDGFEARSVQSLLRRVDIESFILHACRQTVQCQVVWITGNDFPGFINNGLLELPVRSSAVISRELY